MRITHQDRLEVRFDKSTLRTNADGSRTIDGFGAHVGPYTYHDDKGRPFVEQVPRSTLFDQRSLDSAAGSTLTIRHGPGLVTPDRYRAEAHGSWVKAWDAGDGKLGARLRVSSREALDFVAAAVAQGDPVELSPVYEVDVVERSTADGRTELVQEGRMYSGIALLGPDEARGGPGTRLQLDGPRCAPKDTRIEVARVSLDSAPREPLHSDTKSRKPMKTATIRSEGFKPRKISQPQLAALSALTVKGDQIETGRVLIEIEGEEPQELVLPVAMIEAFLTGLGATVAPDEPAPPDEEIALEALDAGSEDEGKLDAKAIGAMIDARIDARDRKRVGRDARRAQVNADAATILPAIYDYSVPWHQVCLDALALAEPGIEGHARGLAKKAANGDAVAEGRLRQMLADRRRTPHGASLNLEHGDAADSAKPWASKTLPPQETN